MTVQQMEYIVAVDKHRHFVKAAQSCFVTQATLSMMIKKLEEELGVLLFDRSKHPVEPTLIGKSIIHRARFILGEINKMKEEVNNEKEISGELNMAVIPTVAPYLLPLFINSFCTAYPNLYLKIHEHTTAEIIEKLNRQEIDIAILATPIEHPELKEMPLYYERFLVYAPGKFFKNKKYILPGDIDTSKLWLLEEGHCLRSQIINLCELRKKEAIQGNLRYEAGSMETLIKMAEINQGITILPELMTSSLSRSKLNDIYRFKSPEPVREISLVFHKTFYKHRLAEALASNIKEHIPSQIISEKKKEIIEI